MELTVVGVRVLYRANASCRTLALCWIKSLIQVYNFYLMYCRFISLNLNRRQAVISQLSEIKGGHFGDWFGSQGFRLRSCQSPQFSLQHFDFTSADSTDQPHLMKQDFLLNCVYRYTTPNSFLFDTPNSFLFEELSFCAWATFLEISSLWYFFASSNSSC